MDISQDEIFQLPVSGHYDCGYGYGAETGTPAPPPRHPLHQHQPVQTNHWPYSPTFDVKDLALHIDSPRPVSPPTILPNSFTQQRTDHETESDLSSLSSTSRQESSASVEIVALQPPSPATSRSSSTTGPRNQIEPDPLPSHSNPQQLTPTQVAAYAGPKPIQPMRLSRRRVTDSHSGETIYEISEETKHKLSGQSIHQIYDTSTAKSIGTIGFAAELDHGVTAILRGKDIFLQRESSTSNRWLFRPSTMGSALTKKSACWYWLRDKARGGVALTDAKKNGTIIARIQRDVLCFDKPGLCMETVTEICIAAMALAELARRHRQPQQAGDLAVSIAQVALGETTNKVEDEEVETMAKLKRRFTLLKSS